MAPTPEQERDYVAQLEGVSNAQIRHDLDHGFIPPSFVHAVKLYLSKRELASNSEQTEIASRAAVAAERASAAAERAATATELQATEARRTNKRATIALIIAIISPIVTAIIAAVGIWITHMDVHK